MFGSLVAATSFRNVTLIEASTNFNWDILITNVTDTAFTVSWVTNSQGIGEVLYGSQPNNLDQIALDIRGNDVQSQLHYIVIQGLAKETDYYFDIVFNGSVDDNSGAHYRVKTGSRLGPSIPQEPVRGQIFKSDGETPVAEAIVYASLTDEDGILSQGRSALMSSLVTQGGYWHLNLSNARVATLDNYFTYTLEGDGLEVIAQGGEDGNAHTTIIPIANSEIAPLVLEEPPITLPTCQLYAVNDESTADSQLFTVDFETGIISTLGPEYKRADLEGLDFNPITSRFYGSSGRDGNADSELYLIDPESGELELVGRIRDDNDLGFFEVTALSFHADGSLWGFAAEGLDERRGLIQINPETAQASLVKQSTLNISGMAWFEADNTLWLVKDDEFYRYTEDGDIVREFTLSNLPGEVEGLESHSQGLMMSLARRNTLEVFILDVSTQTLTSHFRADQEQFDDIESLAWPNHCE